MKNKEELCRDYLHYYCEECKKHLKVNIIKRKRIDPFTSFNLFIFYCSKCKFTYLIFKKNKKKDSYLILEGELEEELRDRFEEGFIIVQGESKAIMKLEEEVYTPGTEKNRNFIAILLPTFPPSTIFLAKKTRALKELLKAFNPQMSEEFGKLIAITFYIIRDNRAIAKATFLEEKSRQESIYHIIKQIKSKLTGLEVV
jgi:hypothetical protein